MEKLKDRILNIGIIVLVIACLFLGGRLLYTSYMDKCEIYNQNIIDFTVEMIKGNKSLEDIDTLDANDSVKESLRKYYNDTFYLEGELILVYEDYQLLDEIIKDCEKFRKIATVDGVFDIGQYEEQIMIASEKKTIEYMESLTEDEREEMDSPPLWDYFYSLYEYNNKDRNDLILREEGLYVSVNDLVFTNAECIKYYNGFPISIYRDILDKKIKSEIIKDTLYQSIEFKAFIEREGFYQCNVRDELDNIYNFYCTKKLGKVDTIEFK